MKDKYPDRFLKAVKYVNAKSKMDTDEARSVLSLRHALRSIGWVDVQCPATAP